MQNKQQPTKQVKVTRRPIVVGSLPLLIRRLW
jgi:hypothetical protein